MPVMRLRSLAFLAAEPMRDEMAPIVQVLPIHDVIFDKMPARRLDIPDAAALFLGHALGTEKREGGTAAPEAIERSELEKGLACEVGLRKRGRLSARIATGSPGECGKRSEVGGLRGAAPSARIVRSR